MKQPRPKPIVDLRALDYRWVELADNIVPGSISPELKAAWRLQYRREGDVEWTALPVVKIDGPPPEEEKP